MNADELRRAIEAREARVGIIGLGYVGLPLALAFSERGFRVLGFDVDPRKVEELNEGRSYIPHLDEGRVATAVRGGRFEATAEFDRLVEADAVVICVPTPLDVHQAPDMTYIVATSDAVAERIRPGQLVVLESTTYPGTTDELMRERLERPASSREAFEWRLFGPVGPLALAEGYAREATFAGEAKFCLAEIALALHRVQTAKVAVDGLPVAQVAESIKNAIAQLREMAGQLAPVPELDLYAKAAFEEAAQ